jgi:hypothetical protein
VKVAAAIDKTHNPLGESHWVSCLRENLTSSSYGEGLETGRVSLQVPRQSFTRQLFFKALKQNLKIKTFVGTSPNAVKTQLWCALISMLLLRYLQLRSRFGWSLSNLVALLRMNLFTHRDLEAWLQQPFGVPPNPAQTPLQAPLAFA